MIPETESFDAFNMPKCMLIHKTKRNESLTDKPLYCMLEVANQQMQDVDDITKTGS
jgi:hypothetical protein